VTRTFVVLGSFLIAVAIRAVDRGGQAACGIKGSLPGARIINGSDADNCEWVWQVSLQQSGSHVCGGVLVSEDWVLTAAHCIMSGLKVVLGVDNLKNPSGREQVMEVAETILHPGWQKAQYGQLAFDMALMRLQTSAALGGCVAAACLPAADEEIEAGSTCWISGWGAMGYTEFPDILQELQVKIVDHDACMNEWVCKEQSIRPSTALCIRSVEGHLGSACHGDSGGPLVCETPAGQWKVFGVTSFGDVRDPGERCSSRRMPNAYSSVHLMYDFIEAAMSGSELPGLPSPQEAWPSPSPETCGCPEKCGTIECWMTNECRRTCALLACFPKPP